MPHKQKPIIAIDVDDVLANSTDSVRRIVNQKYAADLQPEHYAVPGEYHKYYERVWAEHGITDRVSKDELNQLMATDQSHVQPHTDVLRILSSLNETYELLVVTARNPSWEAATRAWLDSNFPGIFTRIIFGGRRDDPAGVTKGDWCVETGAKWLIDDNVVHCMGANDRGVKAILFGTYGWQTDVPADLIRCKNWQEVKEFFDGR
jgi:5'(3')-deoxyribonucleotidase